MKDLIVFEQVSNFKLSYILQFTTDGKISNKRLRIFFSDVSEIIKKLDSRINLDNELFPEYKYTSYWSFGLHLKYQKLSKSLEVKKGDINQMGVENIIRFYEIDYQRVPRKPSEEIKTTLEDNQLKKVALLESNINIISIRPPFSHIELTNRVISLPYVDISDDYEVFELDKIVTESEYRIVNGLFSMN